MLKYFKAYKIYFRPLDNYFAYMVHFHHYYLQKSTDKFS